MEEKKLREDRYRLLFSVRRSVRYHCRRQQFFDRLDSSTSFANLVLGSAAIVALMKDSQLYGVPVAALVTILSSINLVVGYSRKARLHERLAYKFVDLEKKIISINVSDFTEANLAELTAERLNIETEEPPIKVILDSICHNEMLRAEGNKNKDEYVNLTLVQRIFAQVCDIGQHAIVKPGYPKF
jgi:hypothetical protein